MTNFHSTGTLSKFRFSNIGGGASSRQQDQLDVTLHVTSGSRASQSRALSLTTQAWATVKDLKDQIGKALAIPPSAQRLHDLSGPLSHHGRELPNRWTLLDITDSNSNCTTRAIKPTEVRVSPPLPRMIRPQRLPNCSRREASAGSISLRISPSLQLCSHSRPRSCSRLYTSAGPGLLQALNQFCPSMVQEGPISSMTPTNTRLPCLNLRTKSPTRPIILEDTSTPTVASANNWIRRRPTLFHSGQELFQGNHVCVKWLLSCWTMMASVVFLPPH
jgi:hypothetical protein